MHVMEMVGKHPGFKGAANVALIHCVEECYNCAQTCASCADASLAEDDVKMLARCVRLNLDCTDMCVATGAIATRHLVSESPMLREILAACELTCRRCEEECLKHASHHAHCRVCAEVCANCRKACEAAIASIGA
ncbi:MAG TPA: four-helix bundle copper-binding protein [Rhizomicrobium sp.]|nr:four-helix bundle copper-binding protein [Rhizomicrobium sp.]